MIPLRSALLSAINTSSGLPLRVILGWILRGIGVAPRGEHHFASSTSGLNNHLGRLWLGLRWSLQLRLWLRFWLVLRLHRSLSASHWVAAIGTEPGILGELSAAI